TTASQAVTIDATAPTITISNAGGPTNQASQTITGTVDVADAGATVTVYDGSTPVKTAIVQGDGSWSAGITLSNGSNSLTAQVSDLAGNSTTSNAVVYTLSTTGPAVTEHLSSDTGSSALDGITSNPALSGTGLASTVVYFTIDGTPASTTTTADASGNWSFAPSGLANGQHTIVASQTDTFGNTGSASLTFTLDTTAPSEAVSITAIATDSGSSSSDFITNDTSLTVSGTNGTLASGEKIQASSDGGLTWADVTQSTSTSWSYVDPATHATSFTYQTRIIDTAGNIGTTASQAVTIDATAPTITISNAGGPTNQASQTITGTVDVADAGATVTVYDGSTPVKTAIVQGDGSWSAGITLSNGSNSLTAQVSDLAGNSTTSNAVVYTLSTTGPAVTEHLSSDTGSSALDGITSNPALSGTGLASTVVYFTIDGTPASTTTTADASGNWSFAPSGLANGQHTIVASQTDTFGNTGSASLTFTLD
ncbi:Ig-like domain-containing protein, partial [Frankia sp. RB7]|nr:Ig-like domain-containing protein [Frankia sp. RB7]